MDSHNEYTTWIRTIIWTNDCCLPMKHIFSHRTWISTTCKKITYKSFKELISSVPLKYLHYMKLVDLFANPGAPSIFSSKPFKQIWNQVPRVEQKFKRISKRVSIYWHPAKWNVVVGVFKELGNEDGERCMNSFVLMKVGIESNSRTKFAVTPSTYLLLFYVNSCWPYMYSIANLNTPWT